MTTFQYLLLLDGVDIIPLGLCLAAALVSAIVLRKRSRLVSGLVTGSAVAFAGLWLLSDAVVLWFWWLVGNGPLTADQAERLNSINAISTLLGLLGMVALVGLWAALLIPGRRAAAPAIAFQQPVPWRPAAPVERSTNDAPAASMSGPLRERAFNARAPWEQQPVPVDRPAPAIPMTGANPPPPTIPSASPAPPAPPPVFGSNVVDAVSSAASPPFGRASQSDSLLSGFKGDESSVWSGAGRAFTVPFQSTEAIGIMLLQGLIALIPIVGPIALAGWALEYLDRVHAGDGRLPAAGFRVGRGVQLFLPCLFWGGGYFLGLLLLYVLAVAVALNSYGESSGAGLLGALVDIYWIGGGLFLGFIWPAVYLESWRHGARGGVNVAHVLRVAFAHPAASAVAALISFAGGIIYLAGGVLCYFGYALTVGYGILVMSGAAYWLLQKDSAGVQGGEDWQGDPVGDVGAASAGWPENPADGRYDDQPPEGFPVSQAGPLCDLPGTQAATAPRMQPTDVPPVPSLVPAESEPRRAYLTQAYRAPIYGPPAGPPPRQSGPAIAIAVVAGALIIALVTVILLLAHSLPSGQSATETGAPAIVPTPVPTTVPAPVLNPTPLPSIAPTPAPAPVGQTIATDNFSLVAPSGFQVSDQESDSVTLYYNGSDSGVRVKADQVSTPTSAQDLQAQELSSMQSQYGAVSTCVGQQEMSVGAVDGILAGYLYTYSPQDGSSPFTVCNTFWFGTDSAGTTEYAFQEFARQDNYAALDPEATELRESVNWTLS